MPLLQWLPHSYVGPSQLHRNIIRGTMKCPGHWQLIWLTVQYFYQGNKPQLATEGEARVGFWVEVGGKESAKEQNRGFGKCFPCCTHFSFLREMKAWLSAYELVSPYWCPSSIFPSITSLKKWDLIGCSSSLMMQVYKQHSCLSSTLPSVKPIISLQKCKTVRISVEPGHPDKYSLCRHFGVVRCLIPPFAPQLWGGFQLDSLPTVPTSQPLGHMPTAIKTADVWNQG